MYICVCVCAHHNQTQKIGEEKIVSVLVLSITETVAIFLTNTRPTGNMGNIATTPTTPQKKLRNSSPNAKE